MITDNFETSEVENDTLSGLTPLEEKIVTASLAAVLTGEGSVLDAAVLTQEFFDNPKPQSLQHEALSAYLLLLSFNRILPDSMRVRLREVTESAKREHSGVFCDTMVGVHALNQEVNGYFRFDKNHPYDYFQVAPAEDELSHQVLVIESHKIASGKKQELEAAGKRGFLVVPFVNKKNDSPGIWMSTKGVKFDQSKLR